MRTKPHVPLDKPAVRPRAQQKVRAEQLRIAKRAQRAREREAGLTVARLRLPVALAKRLEFAARQNDFEGQLSAFLESQTVEIAKYAQLRFLCWNRRAECVTAREAWELYERNWRFVDRGRLEPAELELIRSLAARFGGEVLNV